MKNTILGLVMACAAFGQIGPSQAANALGAPNNSLGITWSRPPSPVEPNGYNVYPTTFLGTFSACSLVTVQYPEGPSVTYPINDQTLTLETYTTIQSGNHSHETGSDDRPQINVQGSLQATTENLGCVTPWTWSLPGYAGWYTIYANYPAYVFTDPVTGYVYNLAPSISGYNVWAQDRDRFGSIFVPYPDKGIPTNVPQSAHVDYGHEGGSRYFTYTTAVQIQASSADYENYCFANQDPPNVVEDFADVFRGSLEFGGFADNAAYSTLPSQQIVLLGYGNYNWEPLWWEEHADGVEVDVVNPASQSTLNTLSAPLSASNYYLLVDAFDQNDCEVGIDSPMVTLPPDAPPERPQQPFAFWFASTYIHFACGPAINRRVPIVFN